MVPRRSLSGLVGSLLMAIACAGCGKTAATAPSDNVPPPPAQVVLQSLSVSPATVVGDGTTQGTIALSGPAPIALTVFVSSNNAAAEVPPSVTVPAGASNQAFTITTRAPSSRRDVTIAATYSEITRTAVLVVDIGAPPPGPGPTNLTGRWTGTVVCSPPHCNPQLSATLVLNIVHSGSSLGGTCSTSTGYSGALSLRFTGEGVPGEQYLLGNCGGSLDLSYQQATDTLNTMWRVDYGGTLRR